MISMILPAAPRYIICVTMQLVARHRESLGLQCLMARSDNNDMSFQSAANIGTVVISPLCTLGQLKIQLETKRLLKFV